MNPFAKLTKIQDKNEGRTFDDWRADGYTVVKGEKATGRNADGIPTFTDDQVAELGVDAWERDEYDEANYPTRD